MNENFKSKKNGVLLKMEWEYNFFTYNTSDVVNDYDKRDFVSHLDTFGAEGWEVFSVLYNETFAGEYTAFMKRPKKL